MFNSIGTYVPTEVKGSSYMYTNTELYCVFHRRRELLLRVDMKWLKRSVMYILPVCACCNTSRLHVQDHKYKKLKFFEQDQVFWTPASTTLGLYAQLAVKRYREINRRQIL